MGILSLVLFPLICSTDRVTIAYKQEEFLKIMFHSEWGLEYIRYMYKTYISVDSRNN